MLKCQVIFDPTLIANIHFLVTLLMSEKKI